MFESVIVAIIRQASLLTKPQQEEFIARAAETLASIIASTPTQIDDALVRDIILPMAAQLVNALGERV